MTGIYQAFQYIRADQKPTALGSDKKSSNQRIPVDKSNTEHRLKANEQLTV